MKTIIFIVVVLIILHFAFKRDESADQALFIQRCIESQFNYSQCSFLYQVAKKADAVKLDKNTAFMMSVQ